MWFIEFYKTEQGEIPVQEFLDGLPPKLKAKAVHDIDLLEEFGNSLREPHSKALQGEQGLFKLRVKIASDIARVFYFFFVSRKEKLF